MPRPHVPAAHVEEPLAAGSRNEELAEKKPKKHCPGKINLYSSNSPSMFSLTFRRASGVEWTGHEPVFGTAQMFCNVRDSARNTIFIGYQGSSAIVQQAETVTTILES